MKRAWLLLCALALAPLSAARADETPAPAAAPTSFGGEAPPAARAAPAPGDLPAMLQSCDAQLRACEQGAELCEKDRTGVGFLGAAYIGLWVILLAFFLVMRNRQRRLMAELRGLQERLAKLQGGG
jgi:hypothetical protein